MEEKIKKIIQKEISFLNIKNAHGIGFKNIEDHLIDPIKENYFSVIDDDLEMLWTVLKEVPDKKTGYLIYFNLGLKEFGLGIYGENNKKIDIGIYGSFVETLNSM